MKMIKIMKMVKIMKRLVKSEEDIYDTRKYLLEGASYASP